MIFDENKKMVSFHRELEVIREIVDELKQKAPQFELRLILTGLKIIGKQHIEKMIRHLEQGTKEKDRKLAELVVGFDMVNEEDFTPEISFFAEGILGGK